MQKIYYILITILVFSCSTDITPDETGSIPKSEKLTEQTSPPIKDKSPIQTSLTIEQENKLNHLFDNTINRSRTILEAGGCPEEFLKTLTLITQEHSQKDSLLKEFNELKKINPNCNYNISPDSDIQTLLNSLKDSDNEKISRFSAHIRRTISILEAKGCPEIMLASLIEIANSHPKKDSLLNELKKLKPINPKCPIKIE